MSKLFVRRAILTSTLLLVKIGEERKERSDRNDAPYARQLAFRTFRVPLGRATGAIPPESLPD